MIARPGRAVCIALLLASVAGCASHGSPAAAPPSSPSSAPAPSVSPADSRTPLQILTAGIPTGTSVAYRFSIADVGGPTYGVIDPATKTAEYDVVSDTHQPDNPKYTMTLKVLRIGKKAWAQVVLKPNNIAGLSYIPRRWMVLAPKKIAGGLPNGYQKDSDPAYAGDVFAHATYVRQTSPGHFEGIADITDSGNDIMGDAWIEDLGDTATVLPFTATLDAQGRLTTVSVALPASLKFPAFTYKFVYQYTSVKVPTAPTATTKAIPEVYQWIGY